MTQFSPENTFIPPSLHTVPVLSTAGSPCPQPGWEGTGTVPALSQEMKIPWQEAQPVGNVCWGTPTGVLLPKVLILNPGS